jgi:pilus assembly protein CpaB
VRRKWSPASKLFLLLALASGAGAFLVVSAYATKLEALRPAVGDPVPMVVAARDIARGTQLSPDMLTQDETPSSFAPPGSFGAITEVEGRTLLAPLATGEPVTETRLASTGAGPIAALVPPGLRAFVVTSDVPDSVVRQGDTVDVLATFGGGRPYTDTVAEGVEVLSVLAAQTATTSLGGPAPPAGGTRLVLVVSPELAERLAHAAAFAELSVTIAPPGAMASGA